MLILSKALYSEHLKTFKKAENHQKKYLFLKNVRTLLEARQDVLNNLKSNTFPIKANATPSEKSINEESFMGETSSQQKGTILKILTPKQML